MIIRTNGQQQQKTYNIFNSILRFSVQSFFFQKLKIGLLNNKISNPINCCL